MKLNELVTKTQFELTIAQKFLLFKDILEYDNEELITFINENPLSCKELYYSLSTEDLNSNEILLHIKSMLC